MTLYFIAHENHTFYQLLYLVGPFIEKQNTLMRESISAEERFVATLRFLAIERSYEDLKFSSAISAKALGNLSRDLLGHVKSIEIEIFRG